MKTPKFFLLLQLFLLPLYLLAQVQWYQTQDGNNPPPNGTFGATVKSFTKNSFVASYQWSSADELYTWKVSKSHINGTEQKCFFVSGTWASVEVRVGKYNSLYVLLRSFPLDENAFFKVYKLDTNLVVKAQRQISVPNNFSIYNINAIELDAGDNIFLTGDGQYPGEPATAAASFVMKLDKNLVYKWRSMENRQTSFARLHIEPYSGKVLVIEDYSSFFPQVKIRKYSSTGMLQNVRAVETDAGRFNLLSKMDEEGNLFLYGGKTIGDTAQAMFLTKLSRQNGTAVYNKTYFTAPGIQLNDVAIDNDGRIFTAVTQYRSDGDQQCVISRINPYGGTIQWSRQYLYSADSCSITKLVVNDDERFYVIGEKRNSSFLSKGMVMRIKKNGQQESGYNGPDSIGQQRSHVLIDGITDRNGQLITIGNTNDFDPYTYNSTYFRAFAVRFGQSSNHHGCEDGKGNFSADVIADVVEEKREENLLLQQLTLYPNPAQHELMVSNISKEEADQLAIYTLPGALIMKQSVNSNTVRIDVSNLSNGVYLLVLRSSITKKQRTIKFVVKK